MNMNHKMVPNKLLFFLKHFFLVPVLGYAIVSMAAQNQESKPRIVGGDSGVDGSYCESAKADFDLIAEVANEKQSNVIIIARLGKGERARSINRIRLSQVREHLVMVRAYSPDRVVTGEGERVRGLGLVEVYISGKPFIIYRMGRNKDFFKGNFGC